MRVRSLLAQTQTQVVKRRSFDDSRDTLLAQGGELAELIKWQIKDDTHLAQIGRGFVTYEDEKDHTDDYCI